MMRDPCHLTSSPFTCPGCGAETRDLEVLARDCVDYVTGMGRCPARAEVAARRRRRAALRQLLAGDPVGEGRSQKSEVKQRGSGR